jgi:hypothetical protein
MADQQFGAKPPGAGAARDGDKTQTSQAGDVFSTITSTARDASAKLTEGISERTSAERIISKTCSISRWAIISAPREC